MVLIMFEGSPGHSSHAVPRRAFDQVAGLNGAIDNAFIQVFGVRNDIKIHDPGKRYHEKVNQKDVKLEAHAPETDGGQDFFCQGLCTVSLLFLKRPTLSGNHSVHLLAHFGMGSMIRTVREGVIDLTFSGRVDLGLSWVEDSSLAP